MQHPSTTASHSATTHSPQPAANHHSPICIVSKFLCYYSFIVNLFTNQTQSATTDQHAIIIKEPQSKILFTFLHTTSQHLVLLQLQSHLKQQVIKTVLFNSHFHLTSRQSSQPTFNYPEPSTPTSLIPFDTPERSTPLHRRPIPDRKIDGIFKSLSVEEKTKQKLETTNK
ncbi:unnamed protein product [Mytilus coruscus]|uniref:Uncharacterized protein n=1 Tax=Mytilus coruscus TaxID=42192 RepID=A0A6J8ET14_MYTCO|nr:unnamed protein product [Mytilus coruscus]